MKFHFNLNKTKFTLQSLFVISLLAFTMFGCKMDSSTPAEEAPEEAIEEVLEIITKNMDFNMPDTIPSGWTIIRFKNESPQTHFVTIEKYPDGKTLQTIKDSVIPYFDSGMELLNEGKTDEGFAEFGKLPAWFGDLVVLGGVALVSPGQTAESMMKLEPGHYFVECYVKMSNGVFHSSMGMFDEIYVAESSSSNEEPTADYDISISSTEGIVFDDTVKAGTGIFSVTFKDQIVHENFTGHDVNLARVDDTLDLAVVEKWMDWVDPKGLIEPAPQGVTFLGGANNMPAGKKGYFKVDMEPGKYILIPEVPKASEKNMLKTFIVSE